MNEQLKELHRMAKAKGSYTHNPIFDADAMERPSLNGESATGCWETGEPASTGMYFVEVKYNNNSTGYAAIWYSTCAGWNKNPWQGEILRFAEINDYDYNE